MIENNDTSIAILNEDDIVLARQKARATLKYFGFSLVDQTKMVTAVSEIARNTFIHGHGGAMRQTIIHEDQRIGVRFTFVDHGPGIEDIGLAMTDGYTTSGGLGLGLSGSKRLVNEFEIQSEPGIGTTIIITRWK